MGDYFERTLGQTRTQETGNLLDQRVGSQESIVLASELLDELLVLVQLLQILGGHSINAKVLSTVNVVLVTKDTIMRQQSVNRVFYAIFSRMTNAVASQCGGSKKHTRWSFRDGERWEA